jgi:membrane protein
MESPISNHRSTTAGWSLALPSPQFVWDLTQKIWDDTVADNCVDLAAQMSFYFLLSLFPFLLLIAAIVGWLPSTSLWQDLAQWITDYLPRDARAMVFARILDLTRGHTKFFSVGLLTMLWTSSSGFVSLMESLSVGCGVRETRGFWKKRAIAVCAAAVSALFAIASFGLLAFGHWIEETISFRFGSVHVPWEIARWTATLMLMVLGLDLINYFLPNRRQPWRWMSVGTGLASVAYVVASAGFNFYLRHFNAYPRLYGTLAGVIILATWIYLLNLILLVGAEADHAMEQIKGRGASA